MNIIYAASTEIGSRERNEDCLRIEAGGDAYLFAAADGMGGYGNGELASQTCVNAAFDSFLFDAKGQYVLRDAMCAAQEAVLQIQQKVPGTASMGSTLALLLVRDGTAQWAHIGDSRIYRFQEGFLKEHTKDHSLPQMLVSIGEISQQEVRGHPDQNKLLKVIGRPWGEKPFDVSGQRPLTGSDAFLLCTDGFWEYITEEQMEQALRMSASPTEWMNRMLAVTDDASRGAERDNYSVICIYINR